MSVSRAAWISAIAITLAFMAADALPGRLSSLYAGTVGPFLAGAWLSSRFHSWWARNEARVLSMPSQSLYPVLGISLALLLLGGIRLLWVDPWLFAPMLWPLFEIFRTLRRRSLAVDG